MINLKASSYKLFRVPLMFCALAIFGCESQEDVQPDGLQATAQQEMKHERTNVYYGPTTPMLGGTARTWVKLINGKPEAIGIEMSEEVLENMPAEMGMFFLKLPGQAHATGIKTVMVDWNPMGHEPAGVYTVPHFDFHFYMITDGQIKHIEGGVDAGAYTLLEKGILPPTYIFGPQPMAVPQMGVHWVDVTSPEYSPAGFSKTFIYGSNKDRITFMEPMITVAYLKGLAGNVQVETPVPSLLKYEDPGYYPESYTIQHSTTGTYSVALTNLEWHNLEK
ncbi:hypothetical protein ACSX1A_11485 [Pontibacter sp. MBLB2868]|uniref:hypothetical protein n=1 Tax=Pontibacter sp. MBLB2868 TaxID=3451555 RepID=UPI003F74B1D9